MRRTLCLLGMVSLLGIALLSAGCAARSAKTSAEPAIALAPVQLTGADSGSAVTLRPGQKLRIVLDSNPTTGYRWAVDGAIPPVLSQAGDAVFASSAASSNPPIVGAGGTETWVFEGKTAGHAKLRLKYWRSFEPTATPISTFGVTVTVR